MTKDFFQRHGRKLQTSLSYDTIVLTKVIAKNETDDQAGCNKTLSLV